MNESILESIKKLLGLGADYTAFDTDIVIAINTVFGILFQMGIGPATCFSISNGTSDWSDFLGDDSTNLQMVKTFVYLKVRLIFDPPQSSTLIGVINEQLKELEYRIYITKNPSNTF